MNSSQKFSYHAMLFFSSIIGVLVFASHTFSASETQVVFTVHAGDVARIDTPIVVELPKALIHAMNASPEGWTLKEMMGDEQRVTTSQLLASEPPQLAWVLNGETAAQAKRRFVYSNIATSAEKKSAHADDEGITVLDDNGQLEIRCNSKPVLQYHMAHVAPPAGADAKYGRSGYIHPVWTPGGAIVTDEFPPDHLHQDGIFLAYTKTAFEGRQPNFWDLLGGTGFVRHAEKLTVIEGPVCGGFRVRHEHVDNGVEGGKVALDEEWDVRVWKTTDDHSLPVFRFDITSSIRCASESPLELPTYHYGGMAIRGARNWVMDDVAMVTAAGQNRIDGNHARVPWVDLSGKIAGNDSSGWAGMSIFTDPQNFRFPEPVRLHPTMPYFVYTPSVLGDWSIEPGTMHVSRYHYLVHDGKLNFTETNRIGEEIAHPPQVDVAVVQ